MPFPKSYYEEFTNSYCTKIGQDGRGIIQYNFNNFGFINNIDYTIDEKKSICFFGSAITSAIGVPWEKSFCFQTTELLQGDYKSYNFSQGCIGVDNNEIAQTVKKIKEMDNFSPHIYVIQFINLDRRFNPVLGAGKLSIDQKCNIEYFESIFEKIEILLKDEKWIFFGCDAEDHNVPDYITNHKNCLIWNPFFIDRLLVGMPGEKWHRMMALGIKKKLCQLYSIG